MTASVLSSAVAVHRVSSVREIVCGLRKDLYLRYGVTVLKSFVDDSGSDGNSDWYVLAGYTGTVDGWDRFDDLWNEVLDDHPRIEYFKSSEAESLRPDGQWAGVTVDQRNRKIDRLIGVIKRCAHRSFCTRIKQKDYDAIVKGNIPEKWDSPYYILFVNAIAAAINIERIDGDWDEIDFVFDKDSQHQHRFDLILPRLNGMSSLDGRFVNAVRRDEKQFLPLQAADLLAWQTRRFLQHDGGPPRDHFYMARDCPPKRSELFIMDHLKLAWMVKALREHAAEIAASMGVSPDVRKWR